MKLQEILDQLTTGELAQVYVGDPEADGFLTDEKRMALIRHINAALTTLHRRFAIRERRLTVTLQPETFTYVLDSKYAASNSRSSEPVKYLADLSDPFKDDLIQIEQVFDDAGDPLPLNNPRKLNSVRTPNHKTLVLPDRVEGLAHPLDTSATLELVYRGNFQLDEFDLVYPDDMVEVELPPMYLEPLLYYVASRVMTPMGAIDGVHAGNDFMARYEAVCQRLKHEGYETTETDGGYGFERAGWV